MPNIDNPLPIDPTSSDYREMFASLQGNIVKGHGRDYTCNIFLEFRKTGDDLRDLLRSLTEQYVTSAAEQFRQRQRFKAEGGPGETFGSLLLTRHAYRKLGHAAKLPEWFADAPTDAGREASAQDGRDTVSFLSGMLAARTRLQDVLPDEANLEPLEAAYRGDRIDGLLLLADDCRRCLKREAERVIGALQANGQANVLAVEDGAVQRNAAEDGIEHFGYVDGRSQPLFLSTDFENLTIKADGTIDSSVTRENVPGNPSPETGAMNIWNPFARLRVVLLKDPGVKDEHAYGSYYVFRKLEQDVRAFYRAEKELADDLGLTGAERARAGAMIIGRFRDGTPLGLSGTDGFAPPQHNNFRYDDVDAEYTEGANPSPDPFGLKCPFHAHIRKTNPRQNRDTMLRPGVARTDGQRVSQNADVRTSGDEDRDRRIARRGITYGKRRRHPNAAQAEADLPSGGVGVLFACFQRSITNQFSFLQDIWASAWHFKVPYTGIDPLLGPVSPNMVPQQWLVSHDPPLTRPIPPTLRQFNCPAALHKTKPLGGFVRFRGGEFFFAPSLTFLLGRRP